MSRKMPSSQISLVFFSSVDTHLSFSQGYVAKLLKQNIESNLVSSDTPKKYRSARKKPSPAKSRKLPGVEFLALDWEKDSVCSLPAAMAEAKDSIKPEIDVILACDCIYNESLIPPLVRACADLCRFWDAYPKGKPTICIIAQQLRSPDVFETWLTTFAESFRVWRVPDSLLSEELKGNSGFVIHIGVLHSSME